MNTAIEPGFKLPSREQVIRGDLPMIPPEAFRTKLEPAKPDATLTDWLFSMAHQYRGVSRNGTTIYTPELHQLYRGMVGYSGGQAGGYLIRPEWIQEVFDKARFYGGPFSRCRVVRSAQKARELYWTTYFETSRADGSRYGGLRGYWRGSGSAEVESMTPMASGASAGQIAFEAKRLFIYSQFSRDLVSDAFLFKEFIDTSVYNEFRYDLDRSLLLGNGMNEPQGIVGSPGCVVVAKEGSQSASTIVGANIDKMWAALYSPNRYSDTVSWHAADETIQYIDQVAMANTWPENMYIAARVRDNPYPLLKSAPLVPTEGLPAIGTLGDLCLCDWSQYLFVYRVENEADSGVAVDVGLPMDAVEATVSEHFAYDTDELCYKWKFRGDGKLGWPKTMVNSNGATIGPAVVLAARG
jgi:HK97 family phage major capsid protein